MATYDQVMTALRNADAAGNVDDAKRLAQIAASMKQQEPTQPVEQPTQEAMPSQPSQDQGYLAGLTDQLRQGASLGLADEVGAAGAGTGGAIVAALRGQNPTDAFSKSYDRRLGEIRGTDKTFAADHPVTSTVAQIAGGLGPVGSGVKAVSEAPTVLNAIGQGAKTGAIFGGVNGFGSGEGGFGNRAVGAGVGGAAGAALGAAIPAVGYGVGKVAQVGKRMLGLQNPENEASGLLVRALQGDELTPEELATKIGTYGGKPVTIADMADENTRRLMDQVSLQGGVGSKRVNAFLDQRQADQGGRIIGDIKDSLSPSTDTYGLDAKLSQIRSASNPLWEDAMNKPPVWNDRLAQFADEPAVKRGMAQGIKLARLDALAKGETFDPKAYAVVDFNEAGDPIIGRNITWRTWQAAKEGLDAQIADARGPLGQATKQSNALTDVKNALLKELDFTNPSYKAARAAWAGPSAQKEAIDVGGDFLKLDPEQIAARASKMSPDELQAFKVGAARALQDKVDKVKGPGDATKHIFNDNRTKDQIEAAFGQGSFRQFQDAMQAEQKMAATRSFVTGNSRTAQRLAGMQDVGDQIAEGFATGGTKGATARLISLASNRARGLNGKTGEALSNLLTATDPAAQKAALQRLVTYKKMQDALQSRLLASGAVASLSGAGAAGRAFSPRGD